MLLIDNKEYTGSAIYCIWNIYNGRMYFGQAENYYRRASSHYRYFKRGDHNNTYMQREFLKRNDCFIIAPIEICLINELDDREKFWIDFYKTENKQFGYNLMPGGRAVPKEFITWTYERRREQSERIKKNNITPPGGKHSEETKQKRREGLRKYRERNPIQKRKVTRFYNLTSGEFLGEFINIKIGCIVLGLSYRAIYDKFYKIKHSSNVITILSKKILYKIEIL